MILRKCLLTQTNPRSRQMAFRSTFSILPPFLHFSTRKSFSISFIILKLRLPSFLYIVTLKKFVSWLDNCSLLHIYSHIQGSSKLLQILYGFGYPNPLPRHWSISLPQNFPLQRTLAYKYYYQYRLHKFPTVYRDRNRKFLRHC